MGQQGPLEFLCRYKGYLLAVAAQLESDIKTWFKSGFTIV